MNSIEAVISENLERKRGAIARLNPRFRAFSHLAPIDLDLVQALERELENGQPRSAIHGLTISVKGNIPVQGLPWTEGSALYADRVAHEDAAIVRTARAAGGILLGVTTLSELAMYGVENPFEPMGLNPWNVMRTAGGSSTGAGVAAALGLAEVNIGSDSGGSIRNPACHCGVVGFMPRIGALSLQRKTNYTPSLSSVGVIGQSVAQVANAYVALGGRVQAKEAPKRLLVPRKLIESMCDSATRNLFETAMIGLDAAGFELRETEIASWHEAERAAGVISLFECGQALSRIELAAAGEGIRKRAAAARALDADMIDNARQAARGFKEHFREAIESGGSAAVITPTWPFAAPLIEADTAIVNGRSVPLDPHRNCFVRAANAIDACAITVPMGLYPDVQMPSGIHLMTLGGQEARLLDAAQFVEAAMPRLPAPPPLRPLT